MVVQAQDRISAPGKPAANANTTADSEPEEEHSPEPTDALAAANAMPAAPAPAAPAASVGAAATACGPHHGLPAAADDRSPGRTAAEAGLAASGGTNLDAAGDAAAVAASGDSPAAAAAHPVQPEPADTGRMRPAGADGANRAIELAFQRAMREAAGADPAAASSGPSGRSSLLDNLDERGSRSRRTSETDRPGGRLSAPAAGRGGAAPASNTDAATPTGSSSVDAAALLAEIISQPGGAGPAIPPSVPTADASLFALTMNQAAPSGMAATRADMLAELTQASIEVAVDHADFAEAFARQSANLIVQGSNNAEIHLNPRDMGPIRIAISLDADAASLDINAANADTRAAIEASLPALRQMLGDQGLRLANWRLDGEAGSDPLQHPPASDQPPPGAHQQRGADAGGQDGSANTASEGQVGSGDAGGLESRPRSFSWQHPPADPQSAASRGSTSLMRPGAGSSRIDLYA